MFIIIIIIIIIRPSYSEMICHSNFSICCQNPIVVLGLQRYIFPRHDTYLDTRATIRYINVRDKTSYQQLALLLNNLFP